jgi:hypothetical protein
MSILWTGSGSRFKSNETTLIIWKKHKIAKIGKNCGLDPGHVPNQMRQHYCNYWQVDLQKYVHNVAKPLCQNCVWENLQQLLAKFRRTSRNYWFEKFKKSTFVSTLV